MTTIAEKFNDNCMHNYSPFPCHIVKGKGSVVVDSDGKEYIDLAGGIAVTALGHGHPQLHKALVDAADGVWHLSNFFTNSYAVDLAEKICQQTFADKVFFANSGSEANEAALKLARKYGQERYGEHKHTIVSCLDSFHGRTLLTVSVGGQAKYSDPFAPLPAGIVHIPFNDCQALAEVIDENCCAFIVEPVQGEGGVIPATKEFLQEARRLCTEHNALMICDEVQCGMGRTGKLFHYMYHDLVPDIVTSAKALGCGIPISALLMTEDISTVLSPGTHGSTFGGNPIACAVANVALDTISQPELLGRVYEAGEYVADSLHEINSRLEMFDEIRGVGLLIGAQLKPEYQHLGKAILDQAIEQGVLLLTAAGGSVLRLAPSLIIDEDVLKTGLERVEATLTLLQRGTS